jgi:hypothetical protein
MSRASNNRSGRVRWSDDQIKRLVDQYNSGDSAGVLAQAFGVSRNAVLGQINRAKKNGYTVRSGKPTRKQNGPSQRAASSRRPMRAASRFDKRRPDVSLADDKLAETAPSTAPIPAAPSRSAGDTSGAATARVGSSLEASASAPAPDLEAAPSGSGVLLEDVGPGQCRFPLWPHKAKPGSPGYGVVCGADISVAPSQATTAGATLPPGGGSTERTVPAPLYCEAHRKRCSDGKPKRSTKASAARLKLPHLKPQVAR